MANTSLVFSDVMLDLETLGTAPGSVIISIGAVAFSPDMEEKEWRRFSAEPIGVATCKAVGLTTDLATIEWWKQQTPEARAIVDAAEAGGAACVHIVEALHGFTGWLSSLPHTYGPDGVPDRVNMWGNGSDFDNVLLGVAYAKAAVAQPWRYGSGRCFRTMRKAFPTVPAPEFTGVKHNALADAIFQTRWLQAIWLGRTTPAAAQ
jgi:hypothetical protein